MAWHAVAVAVGLALLAAVSGGSPPSGLPPLFAPNIPSPRPRAAV